MTKHHSLTLKVFVHGISPDLFRRYFEKLSPDRRPSAWGFLNEDALQQFLDDPQNDEASGAIIDDFRRINDIATDRANLLVQAYHRAGVGFDQDSTVQELGMRLFLDYPEAFQFAWSQYLLFSSGAKLSFYSLGLPNLQIADQQLASFRVALNNWFSSQAKGRHCMVNRYEDEDRTILYIQRGSYLHTQSLWKVDHIEIEAFRVGDEDLVVYNSLASTLTIKSALAKDREFYLEAFARHVAGDANLAQIALKTPMFTLDPLQENRFDYKGNEVITGVDLVMAKIRLDDLNSSELEIKSLDVLTTMQQKFSGLSLRQGQLTSARLRFQVQPKNGRPQAVTFDIEPPARTDLTQKQYADPIEEYLKEQGVLLH